MDKVFTFDIVIYLSFCSASSTHVLLFSVLNILSFASCAAELLWVPEWERGLNIFEEIENKINRNKNNIHVFFNHILDFIEYCGVVLFTSTVDTEGSKKLHRVSWPGSSITFQLSWMWADSPERTENSSVWRELVWVSFDKRFQFLSWWRAGPPPAPHCGAFLLNARLKHGRTVSLFPFCSFSYDSVKSVWLC